MERVLVAGATGYLGKYVAREFKSQHFFTRIIARNVEKFRKENIPADQVMNVEVTNRDTLRHCCADIDIVFSSIGITRQKDGLTYMDVDYQANLNLLEEARSHGVKKFIYVSVLNGDQLRHLKICAAKERFADALKNSGMEYCILRPPGYFSDMTEIFSMAEKGRVFLFGNGEHKMNPIHGDDLAKVCVDAVAHSDREIPIGGPDVFTYNEIARIAFSVCREKTKISHIPAWLTKLALVSLKTFTGSKVYGPVEFLTTVLSRDMTAKQYGNHHLNDYFGELKRTGTKSV